MFREVGFSVFLSSALESSRFGNVRNWRKDRNKVGQGMVKTVPSGCSLGFYLAFFSEVKAMPMISWCGKVLFILSVIFI